MSLTMNYLKQRKLERHTKNKYASKRIENLVLIELKEKLEEYLTENDKVMLEVNPKVVGEFLNILTDTLLAIYDYEQIDENKFIFYNKEITV
jgi:hypothetical protein